MKGEKKKDRSLNRARFSLAGQVLLFSLLAAVLTAILSFFVLRNGAEREVWEEREAQADRLTEDLVSTVKHYPAYEWLLSYWFQHGDTLDVEYTLTDSTIEKAKRFSRQYPGLTIDYLKTEELEAMPEADRKLYAEIVYGRLVDLLNSLKEIYEPSYLGVLIMNTDYTHGTFILCGASAGQKRGSNYEDAYVIGVEADSTPEQKENMLLARSGGRNLARSGNYVDCYGYVQDILDSRHVVVAVTYDISGVEKEVQSQVIRGMLMFIGLQLVLAFLLYILIYMTVVRPVGWIQKNVWLYQEEKNSEPVLKDLSRIRLRNELGALSTDISDMVVSIDQYVSEIREITADKERIEAELNVAKRIQAEMLPSKFPAFPERTDFDLFALMSPAKEVGGDFYDFFLLDEHRLVLVIADVSGKGVPAALFMVNAKTRIQTQAGFGHSPREILSSVNEQLCEGNEIGFFVTVWLAIINLDTGKGIAANAGHEHPVLRHADGRYELIEYMHSPAVGIMEGIPMEEHEFELKAGDRIFVYTDGVPEATNGEGELFGTERMLKVLNSYGDASLEDVLHGMKKEIDTFVGDSVQFDDITMLGFDYRK